MLEIVITGRNDDFGGADFFDRLCAAAEHNHRLLEREGVAHCYTLVEWNPIEGRPLLIDRVRARLPWLRDRVVGPLSRVWPAPLALAALVSGSVGAPLRAMGARNGMGGAQLELSARARA